MPDSSIIEKAKLIAAEANIQFDPGEFNFSTKWLYKWKQHNNIKHTPFHGEGEARNLTYVAIVRYNKMRMALLSLLMLLLLLLLLL